MVGSMVGSILRLAQDLPLLKERIGMQERFSLHFLGSSGMKKPIVVVNADKAQCLELCAVLEQEHFRTTALHSLMALEGEVKEDSCRVVIVDLDSLPVDNLQFRALKRKNPEVQIVVLSSRPFHPELEEAMSRHISSCLSKPLDTEELIYWISSVCDS